MTGNYVKANGIAPDRQKVSSPRLFNGQSVGIFGFGSIEKKSTKCYQV